MNERQHDHLLRTVSASTNNKPEPKAKMSNEFECVRVWLLMNYTAQVSFFLAFSSQSKVGRNRTKSFLPFRRQVYGCTGLTGVNGDQRLCPVYTRTLGSDRNETRGNRCFNEFLLTLTTFFFFSAFLVGSNFVHLVVSIFSYPRWNEIKKNEQSLAFFVSKKG